MISSLSYVLNRLHANYARGDVAHVSSNLLDLGEDDDGLRTVLLFCFLRYIEDNAQDLSIEFSDQERLESILPAYGTAFFTQAQFITHVVNLAVKLGMDSRAFRTYVESLSAGSIKKIAPWFDVEPGFLTNADTNGISLLLDQLFQHTARRRFDQNEYIAPLVKRLCGGHISPDSSVPIRLYDPCCHEGDTLLDSWNTLRETFPGRTIEVGATSADGISVATVSMKLFINGYRGDYSLVCVENKTAPKLPTDRASYDIAVTGTPWYRDRRYAPPSFEVLLDDVFASIKAEGIGIVAAPAGALWNREYTRERETLVERHRLTACIEFDDYRFDGSLWVLGQGARDSTATVFLASLQGDGLAKAQPDFYKKLGGTPEERDEAIDWLVQLVSEQECLPFLSAKVPAARILERRDASLRFSAYETNLDMASRVKDSTTLQTAWSHYQDLHERMGKAADSFYEALAAIVAHRGGNSE